MNHWGVCRAAPGFAGSAKNIVVVSGVAVGMFFIICVACCTFLPEIYDRNPDYAEADMEETGATVIRDNNPDYR